MASILGLVKTGHMYLNKAIEQREKSGLGYPTHTYYDLLTDAVRSLEAFLDQYRKRHPPIREERANDHGDADLGL